MVNDVLLNLGVDGPTGEDGNGHLNPVIDRGREPRHGSASRYARYGDSLRIDFLTRLQVIQGSNGVPDFGSGRSVAQGEPVEHVEIMRAMVNAGELAELDGIDEKGNIPVAGEPNSVMLIIDLRSPGARRVAAQIQDSGQTAFDFRWQVKVAGHVEAGHALKDDLLDAVLTTIERPGGSSAKRRLLRHRVQAEHRQHLLFAARALALPIAESFDFRQVPVGDFTGSAFEVFFEEREAFLGGVAARAFLGPRQTHYRDKE